MSSKQKKNDSEWTHRTRIKKNRLTHFEWIDGVKWWMFKVPLQMIVHTLLLLCACIDSALDEQFGIYSKLCTLVWFNSFEMIYYTFQWFHSNYYIQVQDHSRTLSDVFDFFFCIAFIHIQLFVRLHSLFHLFTMNSSNYWIICRIKHQLKPNPKSEIRSAHTDKNVILSILSYFKSHTFFRRFPRTTSHKIENVTKHSCFLYGCVHVATHVCKHEPNVYCCSIDKSIKTKRNEKQIKLNSSKCWIKSIILMYSRMENSNAEVQ